MQSKGPLSIQMTILEEEIPELCLDFWVAAATAARLQPQETLEIHFLSIWNNCFMFLSSVRLFKGLTDRTHFLRDKKLFYFWNSHPRTEASLFSQTCEHQCRALYTVASVYNTLINVLIELAWNSAHGYSGSLLLFLWFSSNFTSQLLSQGVSKCSRWRSWIPFICSVTLTFQSVIKMTNSSPAATWRYSWNSSRFDVRNS